MSTSVPIATEDFIENPGESFVKATNETGMEYATFIKDPAAALVEARGRTVRIIQRDGTTHREYVLQEVYNETSRYDEQPAKVPIQK